MYIVLSQCCLRRVTLLKWSAKKLDQNAPWILFYNSGLVSAWDVPCHEAEFQSSSVSYKTEHFRAVLSWFILVERPPFINTSHKLRVFPDLPFAMKLMPISKSVETIKKAPWQSEATGSSTRFCNSFGWPRERGTVYAQTFMPTLCGQRVVRAKGVFLSFPRYFQTSAKAPG